jgi:HNH endonuclease/AP2 domain
MKELNLYKGLKAQVDDADYEALKHLKWGFDGRYAYTREKVETLDGVITVKKTYLHRCIMKTPKGLDTDHINGDKLDNRRENLRITTRSQNNMNQKKTRGTSKYKGVHWHNQRNKWKAEIKINGKAKYLGLFLTEYEAAMAYNEAAKEKFLSFARLNKGD